MGLARELHRPSPLPTACDKSRRQHIPRTWMRPLPYNSGHEIAPDIAPPAALRRAAHQWAGGERVDGRMSHADEHGRRRGQCDVCGNAWVRDHEIVATRESQGL